MIEAFPLQWPIGYKRSINRIRSKFKEELDRTQIFLNRELKLLGAQKIVISSNIPLRRDGGLFSEYMSKKLEDPGIAVYFTYKGQEVVMCCDQYLYPWENMSGLARGIEAIRAMERYGVSEFMERAFTGFKALPEPVDTSKWWDVLGIDKHANAVMIRDAFRKMVQVHHPDVGGSADMFNRVNKAYQQGIQSLSDK